MNEIETRTYEITATKEQLDIMEVMFETMEIMGKRGCSRTFKLYVDGDGAFRPKFERCIFTKDEQTRDLHLKREPLKTNIDTSKEKHEIGYGLIKKNPDDEEYPDNMHYKYYDFG